MKKSTSKQVPYCMVLGASLRRLRNELGMTQAQVAEAIGLSAPGYSRLESGHVVANILQLQKLGNVFNSSAQKILDHAASLAKQLQDEEGVEVVASATLLNDSEHQGLFRMVLR